MAKKEPKYRTGQRFVLEIGEIISTGIDTAYEIKYTGHYLDEKTLDLLRKDKWSDPEFLRVWREEQEAEYDY